MKPRPIAALESSLGHPFRKPELLEQALTHSSYAREAADSNGAAPGDNEQLEFLGDSVLGIITSEELFRRFPAYDEGELSKLRAHLVSAPALTRAATRLKLGSFLRLGRGEEMSGGRRKPALLANVFEAVVAALYLEAGMEAARGLVLKHAFEPGLRRLKSREAGSSGLPVTDFKSELQEKLQAMGLRGLAYVLIQEEGPAHKKTFTVEARIHTPEGRRKERSWRGQGPSKKSAEQGAARRALRYLSRRQQAGPQPGRGARVQ